MEIIQYPIPAGQFVAEKTTKDTIYLHHTAGGHRAPGVIDWWAKDNAGRVATAYVVGGISTRNGDAIFDGKIYQAFDDQFWAHHLGIKAKNNVALNKKSVGIEVCNYGMAKAGFYGKFVSYVNNDIPAEMVYALDKPWRGFTHYQKYTDKQLVALRELILHIANRHGINVKKRWAIKDFEISADALAGKPGLWMHCNVRKDKWDMHPQPELIDILNSL